MELSQRVEKERKIPWARYLAYMGPGFLVAVGSIDPGNIGNAINAGSNFGYTLLWVVTLGTMMAILLQEMAARLGMVTGRCLGEAIKDLYGNKLAMPLAFFLYIASVSTVLAELAGGAIGINLLTGIPIPIGATIVAVLVGLLIWLGRYHWVESTILLSMAIVGISFLYDLVVSQPDYGQIAVSSIVPNLSWASSLAAVGVLGAIVMPTNFHLHSGIVHSKGWNQNHLGFQRIDTTVSLIFGGIINAAMIITAAAVFYKYGLQVDNPEQAAKILEPLLGESATTFFALGILFSGFAASTTGPMAGAYGLCGLFHWKRDLKAKQFRASSISVIVIALLLLYFIETDAWFVLIGSQVVLGLLLPLTSIPLVLITSNKKYMGQYTNSNVLKWTGWVTAVIVLLMNLVLILSNIIEAL